MATAIHSDTAGNPFFAGSVLRHLAESNVIARGDDGRWAATLDLASVGLPQDVRDVVAARVQHLGDDAGRLLAVAAVAGREFDVGLVTAAAQIDDNLAVDVLERSVAAGLVTEVPDSIERFSFSHALVQHAIVDGLSAYRRAHLHRRVAEELETSIRVHPGDRAAELAHHWFAASGPDHLDKAIAHAVLAGEQANAARAPFEAVRWYRRALDAHDTRSALDEPTRARLLYLLGDAERRAGEPSSRERLLEAAHTAQAIGDPELLVAAALANNRGAFSQLGEADAQRLAVLQATLEAVGPHDSPHRARLLATLAAELQYRDDSPRMEFALEAVNMARRLGDTLAVVDTIARTDITLSVPGRLAERERRANEALALTETMNDPLRRVGALQSAALAQLSRANIGAARRYQQEREAIAAQLGDASLQLLVMIATGMFALLAGRPDDSEAIAEEILRLGVETGQPDAMNLYGGNILTIRSHQGRLGEMIPVIEQLIAQVRDGLPGFPILALEAMSAWTLAHGGQLDAARVPFAEVKARCFDFRDDIAYLSSLSVSTEAAVLLNDRDAAAMLYDRFAAVPDQIIHNGLSCEGAVSHHLGCLAATLGRDDIAERHLENGLALHKRIDSPYHIGNSLLALSRLRRRRDPDIAAQLLDEVLAVADGHGYSELRESAVASRAQ